MQILGFIQIVFTLIEQNKKGQPWATRAAMIQCDKSAKCLNDDICDHSSMINTYFFEEVWNGNDETWVVVIPHKPLVFIGITFFPLLFR